MRKIGILLIFLTLLGLSWLYHSQTLKALPHYSAKEATRCGTCHYNPTGGMLRTQTGVDYALNNHSFKEEAESQKPLLNFSLGENLTLGSDMRFNYIYQDSTPVTFSTFFTMQGAIYIAAKLDQHLLLFYNNDFGYSNINIPVGPQNREVWGMFRRLPFNSYLKVGRFKVPYGIRLDDHTSFVKDFLGFGNRSQDNGIEIGFTPATFFWHLSLTNGAGDPGFPLDNNRFKAVTSKAGFTIKNFGLGASFYYNRFVSSPKFDRVRAGVFGSFSWKDLVILSEVDWGRNDNFTPTRTEVLAFYSEAAYQVYKSVWLKAKWDLWDPNTKIFFTGQKVKDDIVQRVTLGSDIFLYNLADVKLQYRFNIEEPKRSNNELITQLYIFF